MKIIFFGTPGYSVTISEALYRKYHTSREKGVIATVTQPPKPSGRGKILEYSDVDRWSYTRKIKSIYDYADLPEADLGVVAAYGKIIPKYVIDRFPMGVLNVHPSLLPKYRGASPIQAAIAAGETTTGVTVIKMDDLMDHGPIVSSFREEIGFNDTNESLRKKLFERAAEFLLELIPSYVSGKVIPKEQNHAEATFTKLLKKEDGFIQGRYIKAAMSGVSLGEKIQTNFIKDFIYEHSPQSVHNLIRAMYPWPAAWTYVVINGEKKRLKIIRAYMDQTRTYLYLSKVQLEGKNPVDWEEFAKGYPEASFEG